MRKPETFKRYEDDSSWLRNTPVVSCEEWPDVGRSVEFRYEASTSNPQHLRDLSALLLKAADWLEEKEGEK